MDSRSGRRRAERSSTPWLPVLLHLGGLATAVAAWVAMVAAAVGFGREARSGEAAGWLFLALGTVGAVACLLLGLLLGARLLLLLGMFSDYKPKRARRG